MSDEGSSNNSTRGLESGNEVVVITGCSSGIGKATALAFLEEGWTVHATARDTSDLAELEEAGCHVAELDVTQSEQVRKTIQDVTSTSGRIDCLVNNAGIGMYGPVEDIPLREIHRQFDVNTYGPLRLIQAVLPSMREREQGTIINVSSYLGRLTLPGSGGYSGSKYALEAISDALRNETAGFNVNVVLIEPGSVRSEFHKKIREYPAFKSNRSPEYDGIYSLIRDGSVITEDGPLTSSPEEVASVIVNAASCTNPDSRYIVGAFSRLMLLHRFLPARWRDKLYRIVIKLVS